ncbi:hypothetical protein CDL15_Pgr002888 [Punica granatum]|uniref:TF-B3 domain-containing protein n=1 Tax=Punica granatum TaxID=22663 RepID=A0A218X130_PUNGR|nr:hypothetical protein CDL15_Pgr002888 [Punica granatum]PKI43997.1 hypothetical protein CRG98_035582 [Punica granatum]
MSSVKEEWSTFGSVVTSSAAVHSPQSAGCSTNPRRSNLGRSSQHLRENALPLKRPACSEDHNKKRTKKKKRATSEEGPQWEPARKIAFLRCNGAGPAASQGDDHQVSTDLVLYTCPWKIKKKLQESDLGGLSRLLLPKPDVKNHILPLMSDECIAKIGSEGGMGVTVWDRDTNSEHLAVIKYWWSSGCFVLNGHWIDKFVIRRTLKIGDEIGLFWSRHDHKLYFAVLERGQDGRGQH